MPCWPAESASASVRCRLLPGHPPAPRPAARAVRLSPGELERLVRRARAAGLPGAPGGRPRVVGAAHVGRDDAHTLPRRCARARARRSAPTRSPTTDGAPGRRRPDPEGAPPPRRRPAHRVGADALPGARLAAGAGDGVHLQPGRLRGRLSVLRDRRAGLLARPRDGRDRRPGALLAASAGRATGRRVTNVVFMGMGEPLLNTERGPGGGRGAHRRTALRPRRAAHHDQHQRRRARHRAAHRATGRSTRWRSRSTRRGRRCATCSCRSTGASRSTRWSTPRPLRAPRPAGGSPTST